MVSTLYALVFKLIKFYFCHLFDKQLGEGGVCYIVGSRISTGAPVVYQVVIDS